ncbi:glycosyltransferase family 4 protein [Halopseudomonas pelagia]|uniref:glycosyltransferase family 4 protein n=1 Tax=Halopseudomonas pelagia TaxID=553151 RepID=UPI0030D91852|tara:strand:+ start:1542 stop:2666 length:1125 start_codon:yes stop_codon:yes gene_type:complete
MKSFLIVASYSDSVIKFRGALIDALLSQGMVVHVAAPNLSSDSTIGQTLLEKGVILHEIFLSRTGMNPAADLRTFISLFRLVRRVKPTRVLAYTIKPVIYGLLAARLGGVSQRNALITGLGYAFQGDEKRSRSKVRMLVQKLYGFALRGADRVFFQNPDDEALFRSLGILKVGTSSCVVNGSGIAVDQFTIAPLPSQPRFLLIARLLGDKGVREYAEAARQIKARHPEAVFQLVGWIDENPDSISQVELDGWAESGAIDYLGKLDDVRPAIEGCSVYALPSYREGTPRTVLEAMAMGRPIITTDAPGCRETVVHGDNGFLVPVKSVEALVAAMERFILEPELAAQMGQRSREIAVEKYEVHKVNAVMLKEMGIA